MGGYSTRLPPKHSEQCAVDLHPRTVSEAWPGTQSVTSRAQRVSAEVGEGPHPACLCPYKRGNLDIEAGTQADGHSQAQSLPHSQKGPSAARPGLSDLRPQDQDMVHFIASPPSLCARKATQMSEGKPGTRAALHLGRMLPSLWQWR